MPSASTATMEELLAACLAEQPAYRTRQRLRMRWTNCLHILGVGGLAGRIPWTEANPKLRGHFRPKTYTSCRPIAGCQKIPTDTRLVPIADSRDVEDLTFVATSCKAKAAVQIAGSPSLS